MKCRLTVFQNGPDLTIKLKAITILTSYTYEKIIYYPLLWLYIIMYLLEINDQQ